MNILSWLLPFLSHLSSFYIFVCFIVLIESLMRAAKHTSLAWISRLKILTPYFILQTKRYDFPLNFFFYLYLFIYLFFYQTQLGPYIKVNSCEQNASIVKILLWLNGAKPLLKRIDQALNQATTTTKQTNKNKQTKQIRCWHIHCKSGLKHWKRRGQARILTG